MSAPSRDECTANAAQSLADAKDRFWPWVREIGTEAAADLIWHHGHSLGSREAIREVLERRLATPRGAA